MNKRIVGIILCALLFQRCDLNFSRTWENEHIDQDMRSEIGSLNDKLFQALATDNKAAIKSLLSKKLIEKEGSNIDSVIDFLSSGLKGADYNIFNEYYISNTFPKDVQTIPVNSPDGDYSLHFKTFTSKIYVSVLFPAGFDSSVVALVIYGKYGSEWKVNVMQFGQYALYHKTAPDYFILATNEYSREHLLNAYDDLVAARACLKPAENYWQYKNEDNIKSFADKVEMEIRGSTKMPMTFENIETHPIVFKIVPLAFDEGFYPMIEYISTIKLKDTVRLKAENGLVKKEIYRRFPGLDQNTCVLYKAYNEIPDENKVTERYGFVDRPGKQP